MIPGIAGKASDEMRIPQTMGETWSLKACVKKGTLHWRKPGRMGQRETSRVVRRRIRAGENTSAKRRTEGRNDLRFFRDETQGRGQGNGNAEEVDVNAPNT
jgi:hypothetical protein